MSIQPAGGAGDDSEAVTTYLGNILREGAGIKKILMNIPLRALITLISEGKIDIAEFNRETVKTRPGNSDMLLDSMARGLSMNMLIGYQNGIFHGMTLTPTKENPIYITEGGHRFKWIKEIMEGKATLNGNSLTRIQMLCHQLYERIMAYRIRIEVSTHVSGEVPESFVREEYKRTNTLGSPLETGEILRAETDPNKIILNDSLTKCFENREKKMSAKVREQALEFKASIIQILINAKKKDDNLKPEKETLVMLAPTDEERDEAEISIAEMATIEKSNLEKFGAKKSKTQNNVREAPSLELFGPMFYGLAIATNKAEAAAKIRKFFEKSLESKETWRENTDRVKKLGVVTKGKTNGGNRNGRKRYEEGWNILLSIVDGGAVGGGAAGGGGAIAEITYDE